MSSKRSVEELNDLPLANFLADSATAGKPVLAAPLYKAAAPKEEAVQRPENANPIITQRNTNPEPAAARFNPNAPAWVPQVRSSGGEEEEEYPEPDPSNLTLSIKWTKTTENDKIKRVFTRNN